MYSMMKKLITRKQYAEKSEVIDRLDTFYAFGRLDTAQYKELTDLAEEVYGAEE